MLTGRNFSGKKLSVMAAFTLLLLAAFGAGCKGFFPDSTLQSLAVGPANKTIQTGNTSNTQQFTAVGTYNDGTRADNNVTWDSSKKSVATISKSGLATAVAPGSTTISATDNSLPTIQGQTTLNVVPGGVTSIAVSPSFQTAVTGDTIYLKAVDQLQNDISGFVTFTFYVKGTTTVETGMTPGTADTNGQPFTVETLSPTAAPVNLEVTASITVDGNTVTSPRVEVDVSP